MLSNGYISLTVELQPKKKCGSRKEIKKMIFRCQLKNEIKRRKGERLLLWAQQTFLWNSNHTRASSERIFVVSFEIIFCFAFGVVVILHFS